MSGVDEVVAALTADIDERLVDVEAKLAHVVSLAQAKTDAQAEAVARWEAECESAIASGQALPERPAEVDMSPEDLMAERLRVEGDRLRLERRQVLGAHVVEIEAAAAEDVRALVEVLAPHAEALQDGLVEANRLRGIVKHVRFEDDQLQHRTGQLMRSNRMLPPLSEETVLSFALGLRDLLVVDEPDPIAVADPLGSHGTRMSFGNPTDAEMYPRQSKGRPVWI